MKTQPALYSKDRNISYIRDWMWIKILVLQYDLGLLVISMNMYGNAPAVPDFLLSAVTLANNQVAGKKIQIVSLSVFVSKCEHFCVWPLQVPEMSRDC